LAIQEGKGAPLFTLPDSHGRRLALRDLRGHDVIVYFYPRDETPGCTREACAFRDLFEELREHGAVIVGISPDDAASHRSFATRHELPFTLLSDPDKKVMTEYGAWGEKKLYGRTVVGVIRSTVWIGPDGRVKKHWKRVGRPADHPAKVLAAVAGDEGSR
jgi:peroxiredoxin Q/BCP